MLDRFLRPKWDVVSKFVVLELEELIFLSLDVDLAVFKDLQDKISNCSSEYEAYDICEWIGYNDDYLDYISRDLDEIGQEASDILAVAENHIRYGRLAVFESRPRYIWNKIELVIFGDWALSVGFELPDEFPRTIKEQEPMLVVHPIIQVSAKELIQSNSQLKESSSVLPVKSTKVPIPIKGNPQSMKDWISYVITEEKGFHLDQILYSGLQQELVKRAINDYGYKDSTAVKTAWAALGLKSAHKTT